MELKGGIMWNGPHTTSMLCNHFDRKNFEDCEKCERIATLKRVSRWAFAVGVACLIVAAML